MTDHTPRSTHEATNAPPGDYLSLVKPWRAGPPRTIATTRIFTVLERLCESTGTPGRAGTFVMLDTADWVNVVAVTPDAHVVMIEQYRHGTGEVTLELPGGIVDPGETPDAACVRELAEETGFAGDYRGIIGVVSANPAMMNNRVHTGLVLNAHPRGDQHLDPNEEIATRLVPVGDIDSLVRRGVIHHTLVVSALHHFRLLG
ncbi:MAG: NUDIX hydrolase [Planctomycetota bacterium]|nr:NUDIX hydrolase [Planctomycetota bacterium]